MNVDKPYYLYINFFPIEAEYSCSVSAKADVIDIVLKKEKIKTKYLAWLDMGYFR